MLKSDLGKRRRNEAETASDHPLKRSKVVSPVANWNDLATTVDQETSNSRLSDHACGAIVVSNLFVKREKGKSMKPLQEIRLNDAMGVEDDAGAQHLSPRQVLMVGSGDLEQNNLKPGELRENLTISFSKTDSLGPSDSGVSSSRNWRYGVNMQHLVSSGDVVRIGKTCKLRITMVCEPCGHVIDYMKVEQETKTCSSQSLSDGSRVTKLFKSVVGQVASSKMGIGSAQLPSVKALVGYRGMLATCLCGGVIREGDVVAIEKSLVYEALPVLAKDRVRWLLNNKVPPGKVVTIRDLLTYIGEPIGYARALPAVIRSITKISDTVPVHRLVDSTRRLMTRCIENQESRLRDEGVMLEAIPSKKNMDTAPMVSPEFLWEPTHEDLYLQNCQPQNA